MDQEPLVEKQIDDGYALVKRLLANKVDVLAAFWIRDYDTGRWEFYVSVNTPGEWVPDVIREKLIQALRQLEAPWITSSDVTVRGVDSPITQDVLTILRKRTRPTAIRLRRRSLGNLDVSEVYLYPPLQPAAHRPPPLVRIVGMKKVTCGESTEEVQEEVGFIDGFIGETEFNTKLAALISTKFGSPEQFTATYPRVLLEEVASRW